jgi:hypothetical protein
MDVKDSEKETPRLSSRHFRQVALGVARFSDLRFTVSALADDALDGVDEGVKAFVGFDEGCFRTSLRTRQLDHSRAQVRNLLRGLRLRLLYLAHVLFVLAHGLFVLLNEFFVPLHVLAVSLLVGGKLRLLFEYEGHCPFHLFARHLSVFPFVYDRHFVFGFILEAYAPCLDC